MSMPLEHDYIGLTEVSSMESSEEDDNNNVLNLKQTELRLGLPGSQSPERMGLSLSLKGRGGVAKRGFSDAINATSPKWGFSGNGGSQADWAQRGVVFSPRPANGGNMHNSATLPANGVKDVLPPTPAPNSVQQKKPDTAAAASNDHSPPSKAQLVGWPPIRSFRKNTMAANPVKNNEDKDGKSGPECIYVKVSMDGAPYLRKVDLKTYSNYMDLSTALEKMFSCFTIGKCGSDGVQGRDGQSESRLMGGSECVLTFEDKEGDWMLVGDVPWDMFIESCKRLRIMKGSEAIGLAPKIMDKCKSRN